jgi:hypothetical protein
MKNKSMGRYFGYKNSLLNIIKKEVALYFDMIHLEV